MRNGDFELLKMCIDHLNLYPLLVSFVGNTDFDGIEISANCYELQLAKDCVQCCVPV